MKINREKYNALFLNKFFANSIQLENEFNRIIAQHGNSESIKLDFYFEIFEKIILLTVNQYFF